MDGRAMAALSRRRPQENCLNLWSRRPGLDLREAGTQNLCFQVRKEGNLPLAGGGIDGAEHELVKMSSAQRHSWRENCHQKTRENNALQINESIPGSEIPFWGINKHSIHPELASILVNKSPNFIACLVNQFQ